MNRRDFLGAVACALTVAGLKHTIPAQAFEPMVAEPTKRREMARICNRQVDFTLGMVRDAHVVYYEGDPYFTLEYGEWEPLREPGWLLGAA